MSLAVGGPNYNVGDTHTHTKNKTTHMYNECYAIETFLLTYIHITYICEGLVHEYVRID